MSLAPFSLSPYQPLHAKTMRALLSVSDKTGIVEFAQALHTPVAHFGRDGGNFSGGAAAYFQAPDWRETPPRLVIWEIPERTLQPPATAAERAEWRALPG